MPVINFSLLILKKNLLNGHLLTPFSPYSETQSLYLHKLRHLKHMKGIQLIMGCTRITFEFYLYSNGVEYYPVIYAYKCS